MGSSLIWPGGFLCTNPPLVLMYLNLLQQVTSTAVVPSCPSVFLTSIFLCSSSTVTHILLVSSTDHYSLILALLSSLILHILIPVTISQSLNHWRYSLSPSRTAGFSKMSFSLVRSVKSLSSYFLAVFPLAIFETISRSTTIFSQISSANQVLCSWCLEKCIFSYIRWRHCYSIFLTDQWLL